MRYLDTATGEILTEETLHDAFDESLHPIVDRIIAGTATADDYAYLALTELEDDDPVADYGTELHKALTAGIHVQRPATPDYEAIPAATIDSVQVFVNPELKDGGLDQWRDNTNFWFDLITPDAHKTRIDHTAGGWDGLAAKIETEHRLYLERVRTLEHAMREIMNQVRDAETALTQARQARDTQVKALSAAGLSNYRIAQVCEISQPTIARILDQQNQASP